MTVKKPIIKQKLFKFEESTAKMLADIAKHERRTEKATLEILIENEAKRLGIKPSSKP